MSRPRAADAEVTVVSRIAATDTVTMLELASLDGAALPAWEPGAHIDVLMPSGLVRQYSLCGDPTAATWRIAVLREETSRGGSEWIRSSVEEGAALRLAGPRNHFSGPRNDFSGPRNKVPPRWKNISSRCNVPLC